MLDTAPVEAASKRRRAAAPIDNVTDRKFVLALARGLDVLRAFKPKDGLLGNQDIAARTGLPKPTVSRLTYTLTKLGYLTHLAQLGKYQLAPGTLALGYAALANMGIRRVAHPFMQEVADYATAAVALGSRDHLSAIYLEHVHSSSPLALRLSVGSRIPLATTAMGRALLAVLPADERADVLDRLARREGAGWPKIKAMIERALEEIATRGFSISVGDWYEDVNAVGVPLVLADGSGVFAFNCGAPAFRLGRRRLVEDVGPRLVQMVRNIEGVLNGSGGLSRTMQQGGHFEGGQRGVGAGATGVRGGAGKRRG